LLIIAVFTVQVWSTSSAQIFKAVEECDIEKVRNLLASGTDVNARNEDGMTPLMIASRWKWGCSLDMVKLLVENGADVNAKTPEFGTSALMLAVGDFAKVKYLVSKGADINAMENATEVSGLNAIIRAAIYASVSNDLRTLVFLLDNGGDVNATLENGQSVFMVVVESVAAEKNKKKGGLNVVKLLLNKGADVNHKANNGETSLLIAVDYENFSLAKLLLKHGADPNCRMDASLRTPLSIATVKK